VIVVSNLSKSYSGRPILKDVSLNVAKQEVLAVIGPSGSGKTTLLHILDLLVRPTSGAILFDGIDTSASEITRRRLRRRMAMVFQRPTVFSDSVYDNVAYGLRVRGMKSGEIRPKVSHALETVGLVGYEARKAATLSGGEVQRVALARAMVIEPELLLLDEPTANLDAVSTSKVERLLAQVIQ
jgi:tungstate transport system ATP-binding protein